MISAFTGEMRFLSNFYICPVNVFGDNFMSAEHAYQAMKAKLFSDYERIAAAPTCFEAKRIGRQVELDPNFERDKNKIMLDIVWAKFENQALSDLLVSTYDNLLVEGNYWHDNYWGMCSCVRCFNSKGAIVSEYGYNPENFNGMSGNSLTRLHPGRNYLGRTLMAVRSLKI